MNKVGRAILYYYLWYVLFEKWFRIEQYLKSFKNKKSPALAELRTRGGTWTRTDITAHRILSPACLPIPPPGRPKKVSTVLIPCLERWARDEIRTRDPNLGKVVLYQLSYSRISYRFTDRECKYTRLPEMLQISLPKKSDKALFWTG